MHLFDTRLRMGKKLFDEPISDPFTSTIFPDVDREDVALCCDLLSAET